MHRIQMKKKILGNSTYLCAYLVFWFTRINRLISADHRNIVQNFHVLIPMFGVLFMIFAVFAFNKNGDYYHVTIVQYTRVFFSLCVALALFPGLVLFHSFISVSNVLVCLLFMRTCILIVLIK